MSFSHLLLEWFIQSRILVTQPDPSQALPAEICKIPTSCYWSQRLLALPRFFVQRWLYIQARTNDGLRSFWDINLGMGQYLLIPFLGGWTSIYQLFWCSPGVQGFDTLPFESHTLSYPAHIIYHHESHRAWMVSMPGTSLVHSLPTRLTKLLGTTRLTCSCSFMLDHHEVLAQFNTLWQPDIVMGNARTKWVFMVRHWTQWVLFWQATFDWRAMASGSDRFSRCQSASERDDIGRWPKHGVYPLVI